MSVDSHFASSGARLPPARADCRASEEAGSAFSERTRGAGLLQIHAVTGSGPAPGEKALLSPVTTARGRGGRAARRLPQPLMGPAVAPPPPQCSRLLSRGRVPGRNMHWRVPPRCPVVLKHRLASIQPCRLAVHCARVHPSPRCTVCSRQQDVTRTCTLCRLRKPVCCAQHGIQSCRRAECAGESVHARLPGGRRTFEGNLLRRHATREPVRAREIGRRAAHLFRTPGNRSSFSDFPVLARSLL